MVDQWWTNDGPMLNQWLFHCCSQNLWLCYAFPFARHLATTNTNNNSRLEFTGNMWKIHVSKI